MSAHSIAVTNRAGAVLCSCVEVTVAARGTSVGALREPGAFERLFRSEYARVTGIAHRVLADAALAEDVAQEVFVDFHRRHPADAPWAAAWLHRAAAHAALNAVRARGRRAGRERVEAHPLGTGADPAETTLARERTAAVRAALARLPERTAELLVLRYSGLSYAEVAAATGVAATSVGTLLRRAEDAFRKEVGDERDI